MLTRITTPQRNIIHAFKLPLVLILFDVAISRSVLLAAIPLAFLSAAYAAEAGSPKDHPLISRFAGATLEAHKIVEFDQATVIAKPLLNADKPSPGALLRLEGKISHHGYEVRGGKSTLEVMRNYEQALAQSGFQVIFKCSENRGCGDDLGGFIINGGRVAPPTFPSSFEDNERYILAKRDGPNGTVHALVFVMQDSSNRKVNVYQQVVEAKPMATGQVQVLNAAALKQGLESDGKIAVYGVLFDTAQAEIKPESKASLDEMAKLLAQNKALKVYIVGHTDNVGALASNIDLSQRRADAVVKALVALKIESTRLVAKGVASLAPLASNDTEPGRARNRRVELVVQ